MQLHQQYGFSVAMRSAFLPALLVALLFPAACAGVDATVQAGPIDTHVQATGVSGCVTQRCFDESNSDAYEACAEQCRKRFAR
jgi:hypothetical protein